MSKIMTFNPHPGHSMFELDMVSGEVRKCEVVEVDGRKRINQKPDHRYVGALNMENARKKFYKMIAYEAWLRKQADKNKA